MPGKFDTRLEIYTPPYLQTQTKRPVITEAPVVIERGTTFRVRATAQSRIVKARLMRPSAVTHQTDTEQRSVALDITSHCPPGDESGECCKNGCDLDLSLPELEGIVQGRLDPGEVTWVSRACALGQDVRFYVNPDNHARTNAQRLRAAVVVLEPDAVAHALEGCGAAVSSDERQRMLTEAVGILKRQPQLKVYVDAGNASWIDDVGALAAALKASGVAQADGFALNLDGAHFVVDTSRNGNGPARVTTGATRSGAGSAPGRGWLSTCSASRRVSRRSAWPAAGRCGPTGPTAWACCCRSR